MDGHGHGHGRGNSPSSSGLDTNEVAADQKIKPEPSKKRKVIQKASSVVTVMKVESSSTSYVKHKSTEGPPPSDSWSWRKYGQKPIKGSPFPRGYYRCSTSKGCSAKKQVERCKTDSSMIIITYTSDHNHPSPHHHHLSSSITNPYNNHSHLDLSEDQELPITPKKEYQDPDQQTFIITSSSTDEEQQQQTHIFHYSYSPQSPFNSSLKDPFGDNLLDKYSVLDFDGEPDHLSLEPSDDDQLLLPTVTSDQENDGFFNDLEELPIFTSSSFSRFMRRSLFHHDRILVHPS